MIWGKLPNFPFLKHFSLPREAGHIQSITEGSSYNGAQSGEREEMRVIETEGKREDEGAGLPSTLFYSI